MPPSRFPPSPTFSDSSIKTVQIVAWAFFAVIVYATGISRTRVSCLLSGV
jgi:hypothetical protein